MAASLSSSSIRRIEAISGHLLAPAAADAVAAAVAANSVASPSGTGRFKGKVVAVAGASSGIGEVIARCLARDGATVVLGARRVDRLEKMVKEVHAEGGQAKAIQLDVRDYKSCVDFVNEIKSSYGRLDGAFNNAGAGAEGDFTTQTVESFKDNMDLNFYGMYHMMKAESAVMVEQGHGSIVNNISMTAKIRLVSAPSYCVSKSACMTMQEIAAVHVAPSQVRINSVSPGFTLPSEALDAFVSANPEAKPMFNTAQGRMLDAQKDVYPAVAYLLDDASASVTGIDIPIAGGMSVPVIKLG